jgi:hypothetical protein
VTMECAMKRYMSLCMGCIPRVGCEMLTGYCLRGLHCDRCGRKDDLAMVVIKEN